MSNTITLPMGDAKQKRGDTLVGFDFQYTVDGVPTPLTGVGIRMYFKLAVDPCKTKEFEIGSGITVVDELNGWARFDDILRLDWTPGVWVADIEYTFADNTRFSEFDVQITVSNDITR
jgi:hypothetical protein